MRYPTDEWQDLTPAQRARLCHLKAEEAHHLAEGASPDQEFAYMRIAEDWLRLAGDIEGTELNRTPVVESGRPRLKTIDARAIAEFLNEGGTIAKLKEPVAATEQEVIDFLATCGVTARCKPGDMKAYWCNNRRCTMTALVRLANGYRRAQQLAPFAMRLTPSPHK